jgi:hypothetical protein
VINRTDWPKHKWEATPLLLELGDSFNDGGTGDVETGDPRSFDLLPLIQGENRVFT